MSQTLSILIDGKPCSCEKGEFLLQIAKRNGIYIPSLCHHEGLVGLGACRVCIVEVIQGGRSRVVVSCIYPVEGEIEVLTQSQKIKEQRGIILTLLARLAPNSEKIAQMAKFSGVDLPRLANKPDGDRCILCGRCTAACEALGAGAIAKVSRGVDKEIATPYHAPSVECIGCGACAKVCPTDSIATQRGERSFTIWDKRFELLSCDCCGEPLATKEEFEFTRIKQGLPIEKAPLCERCNREKTAATVASTSRHYGGI